MRLPPPITSRTNAKVKALRASLSGAARRSGDLLGLEGEHLLLEAHLAGQSFEAVYLREGSESLLEQGKGKFLAQLRTENWAVLSRDVFDSSVSTATPQGIAATWIIREPELRTERPNVLVVEGLQDPGNLGTLIRSAFAFGTSKVMVTPDTVNQWNPKVVRAAAGAMFAVQVQRLPLEEAMASLRAEKVRTFAAVAGFLSGPEYGYPLMAARHGALTGRVENAEAASLYRYPDDGTHGDESKPEQGYAASLCYDTDFVSPCAILIGNEGAGLSERARQLADEQVSIPSGAESLNAAVAGSVLMYEAMRQIPLRAWAHKQGLRP